MNSLRTTVLVLGFLMLLLAGSLALAHVSVVAVADLTVGGIFIIAGVLLERGRYKPKVSSKKGEWELTKERFKDDTTGKWMRVRYNRHTGERDYIEEDKS